MSVGNLKFLHISNRLFHSFFRKTLYFYGVFRFFVENCAFSLSTGCGKLLGKFPHFSTKNFRIFLKIFHEKSRK